MSHTHRCQFCDQDYPGLGMTGEDEHGDERCDCPVTDTCPGCSEHGACEDCGQRPAGSEINQFLCDPCAERWTENREPPDPDLNAPTPRERYAHEAELFYRERFK